VYCRKLLAGNREKEGVIEDNQAVSIAPYPARIRLPKLASPPSTILEYLCEHFSQVEKEVWIARITAGKVRSDEDIAVTAATPYRHGITIFYFREVEKEEEIPFREKIIFENDHLLVADKPHFLPTTPAGGSVNECLLYRLQRSTGTADLAPLHRLDRETAGLILFSKVRAERQIFTRMFVSGEINRRYEALAHVSGSSEGVEGREWLVENRLEPGDPWFRMRIAPGEVNARTRIVLKNIREGIGHFELEPRTGKKHQLRIHMMSLGFPILNDEFYPELKLRSRGDYSSPLQLLAREIRFRDPISGAEFAFESERRLASP
jgi:tRNA pseudouridine32 synthase/23S rRNA pseudouridine746 synthase